MTASGNDPRGAHHWLGFLVSGSAAFATDAAVLVLLTGRLGVPALIARIAAIGTAMVVGWLCHRRLTFAVAARPSLAEFLRYAGLAWAAAALNYVVFALIVLVLPAVPPLVAMAVSSILAMVASYLGMRYGVFRKPRTHEAP
jgi:putative flippase GtrA